MNKILYIAILMIGLSSSILYGCDRRQSRIRYTTNPTVRHYNYSPPVYTPHRYPVTHRPPVTIYRPNPMHRGMQSKMMPPYKHSPVMPSKVTPSRRLSPVVPHSRMRSSVRPNVVSPSRTITRPTPHRNMTSDRNFPVNSHHNRKR